MHPLPSAVVGMHRETVPYVEIARFGISTRDTVNRQETQKFSRVRIIETFGCVLSHHLPDGTMFSQRLIHRTVCASCRLRASIVSKQLSRTRKPLLDSLNSRPLSTSRRLLQISQASAAPEEVDSTPEYDPEAIATTARKQYGNYLPKDELNEEELKIYERLYGRPLELQEQEEITLGK